MKQLLYIFFVLLLPLSTIAQVSETIVVGEVYDSYTGEPIPNVNIIFQGTGLGTISSPEGMFLLRGELTKTHTMVVSAVGYHTQRFRIDPGMQVGVDIALQEKVGNLADVFVVPGANPALPLMKKVREHRQQNAQDIANHSACPANTHTSLYVSDIQAKHLRRALWGGLKNGMLEQADSTFLIPLYWKHQEADSIVEKATLLTVTDYQTVLEQLPKTYNFYNNNLPILSASILSPLASAGNTYYHYYLVDSTYVDNEKHYLLHFRSKNSFYATFNGEMTIDSATYALRSISVTLPEHNPINYLRQLTIKQTYRKDNNIEDEKLSILLDFAIKSDTSHIFPTLLLQRANWINNEQPTQNITHITSTQPIPTETSTIAALDSLNNTPLFKTAKFLAYILQTGCIPTTKYVEVGKLHHVLRINNYEGLQIALPLRTTEELFKNLAFEGYLAYGSKNRAWRGLGLVEVNLPTERRHIMRMQYSDRYEMTEVDDFQEYIRENMVLQPQISIQTRIMQALPFNPEYNYNTMARRREGMLQFEDEWNSYLETKSSVKIGRLGYGEPTSNYQAQPSFFYATLGASARISFHERKVDQFFHRNHIYNHLPVIYLGAELGSYQTLDMSSYRMYGKLDLMIRQKVDLGMAGNLNYLLQAGMVFGRVPYPLLHIFAANQTHVFDAHRFTLMNSYQYAADQYVALQAHWNGKGILFNLIPGLRYLRLRELMEVKVAYGGQRQDHQSVLPFPEMDLENYNMLQAPNIPYVEMGVGIGNILRIGEVYGIFRLTNLQDTSTPWWAVRFRLHLGL